MIKGWAFVWTLLMLVGWATLWTPNGVEPNTALGPSFGDCSILSGSYGIIPAALKLCAAMEGVVAFSHTGFKTLSKLSRFTPSPCSLIWCHWASDQAGLIAPKKAWSRGWIKWLGYGNKKYNTLWLSWHSCDVSTSAVWLLWLSTNRTTDFCIWAVAGIKLSLSQE